jgi:hypothetical protein
MDAPLSAAANPAEAGFHELRSGRLPVRRL